MRPDLFSDLKKEPLILFTIILRIILPPLVFHYFHPFWAMVINECILDGILGYHHILMSGGDLIGHDNIRKIFNNKKYLQRGVYKLYFDVPLDLYGFIWGLYPVLYKGHKYYNVFEKYRCQIVALMVFRIIGIILIYITKNFKNLGICPNLYIGVYLAVSYCKLVDIQDKKTINSIIAIAMFVAICRDWLIICYNYEIINKDIKILNLI